MSVWLISRLQNAPLEADRYVLMSDGCVFVYTKFKRERRERYVPSLVLDSSFVSADCWQCAGLLWKAAEESHRDPIRDTLSGCWGCTADIQYTFTHLLNSKSSPIISTHFLYSIYLYYWCIHYIQHIPYAHPRIENCQVTKHISECSVRFFAFLCNYFNLTYSTQITGIGIKCFKPPPALIVLLWLPPATPIPICSNVPIPHLVLVQ